MAIEDDATLWISDGRGLLKLDPDATEILSVDLPVPNGVNPTESCFRGTVLNPNFTDVSGLEIRNGHLYYIIQAYYYNNFCSLLRNNFIYVSNSENLGDSWFIAGELYDGSVANNPGELAISDIDPSHVYYTDGMCLKKSENYGLLGTGSFLSVGDEPHVDVRNIIVDNGISGEERVFFGNDGGLSLWANGTMTSLNGNSTGLGYANTNFFGLGITESRKSFYFLGSQDGNTNFYNKGQWYTTRPAGDNADCLIDPRDYKISFQQIQTQIHSRLQLNGSETNVFGLTKFRHESWLVPLYMNPQNPDEIFAGLDGEDKDNSSDPFGGVIWSSNTGLSWVNIKDPSVMSDEKAINAMAMSEDNPDVMYVALHGAFWTFISNPNPKEYGIFRFERNGNSWDISNFTKNLGTTRTHNGEAGLIAPITDIAVDPDDHNNIWITMGSWANGFKVFNHRQDINTSEYMWFNESHCLPKVPFTAIEYQKGSEDMIYAGSAAGVWYKDR